MTKTCSKCGIEKPVSEFYKFRDGYRKVCKKCHNARHNKYRLTKAGKKAEVQNSIRCNDFKGFTLSDKDWDTHWEATECRVCHKPFPTGSAKDKHFDHKHGTSLYRGTLCNRCNHVLGLLNDDIHLLENFKGYLEVHK